MKKFKILTWNLGSGIYNDKYYKKKNILSLINYNIVKTNINNQLEIIKNNESDIFIFQEVSKFSIQNYYINQNKIIKKLLNNYTHFFVNNKHLFNLVVEGKATFTKMDSSSQDFYIPYKSTTRKDDLIISNKHNIVTRIKLSNKELVLLNVHLAPYKRQSDLRLKQINYILDFANIEYNKGNYVIIGGDLNMEYDKDIPNFKVVYPYDYTLRDLNTPFTETSKMSVVDGFITSNNIDIIDVESLKDFSCSDHSPVILNIRIEDD